MKSTAFWFLMWVGFMAGMMTLAQEKPVSKPEPPKLARLAQLELLSAWRKAMLLQSQQNDLRTTLCTQNPECSLVNQKLSQSIQQYNVQVQQTIEKEKLPTGTTFSIDADRDEVAVHVPPEPKKPEEKK